jgi:hypothetical protein
MGPQVVLAYSLWVFPVQVPSQWITRNVFPNPGKGILGADDVFIIVALPDGYARGTAVFIDAFASGGFERSYDGTDGLSFRTRG